MIKSIIKEVIIILLLLLAIILALGVLFYEYIPTNKTVPSIATYMTSESVREELDEQITEEEPILVTYEITASELKNYQKTNQYKNGKQHPFSKYEETTPGVDNSNGTNTNTNSVNANLGTSNTKGETFYGSTGTK